MALKNTITLQSSAGPNERLTPCCRVLAGGALDAEKRADLAARIALALLSELDLERWVDTPQITASPISSAGMDRGQHRSVMRPRPVEAWLVDADDNDAFDESLSCGSRRPVEARRAACAERPVRATGSAANRPTRVYSGWTPQRTHRATLTPASQAACPRDALEGDPNGASAGISARPAVRDPVTVAESRHDTFEVVQESALTLADVRRHMRAHLIERFVSARADAPERWNSSRPAELQRECRSGTQVECPILHDTPREWQMMQDRVFAELPTHCLPDQRVGSTPAAVPGENGAGPCDCSHETGEDDAPSGMANRRPVSDTASTDQTPPAAGESGPVRLDEACFDVFRPSGITFRTAGGNGNGRRDRAGSKASTLRSPKDRVARQCRPPERPMPESEATLDADGSVPKADSFVAPAADATNAGKPAESNSSIPSQDGLRSGDADDTAERCWIMPGEATAGPASGAADQVSDAVGGIDFTGFGVAVSAGNSGSDVAARQDDPLSPSHGHPADTSATANPEDPAERPSPASSAVVTMDRDGTLPPPHGRRSENTRALNNQPETASIASPLNGPAWETARDQFARSLRRSWLGPQLKRTPHSVLVATLGVSRGEHVGDDIDSSSVAAPLITTVSHALGRVGRVHMLGPTRFGLLLAGYSVTQAERLAHGIKNAVELQEKDDRVQRIVFSAGITGLRRDEDPTAALCLAEHCLHVAEREGDPGVITSVDPRARQSSHRR